MSITNTPETATIDDAPSISRTLARAFDDDPAGQGQGRGAALLRSGLAKADAAGLPACLESSKPSNLPFYQHFGFTVQEEVRLPGDEPTLWAMRHEPRRPADA